MTIDTPTSDKLYQLIGLPPTSSSFQAFLLTDQKPTITKLSNYVYHAYKPLGLSFCFMNDQSNQLVLDAIDVYNGQTRDGFAPFKLTDDLPCGLKTDMQAHEIVAMLGEPDRKGGGGQTRMPCWIEYKFSNEQKESGILIQLHGFEWEDREMGWTSFVLF
ncbi:hypothetical protein EDC94DRAFT_427733 [Helicostylum pulchrum]|uniref:Uncharacterized protein n=1 Tax=Helicostylum pulchrum TaxID=562976 RepID=A0ABP9XTJ6_9FUNG|nr:hypothetical protein EDC94DRAFT_427733 [Helicostylum pulchrum]